MENHVMLHKTKHYIFRAFLVVGVVYISQSTHSKVSFAVILRGQQTFYDERFPKFRFCSILGLLGSILAKNGFLPTFQPDNQVNPENRPSKDFKTASASEFAKIGRSPAYFDWSIRTNCMSFHFESF